MLQKFNVENAKIISTRFISGKGLIITGMKNLNNIYLGIKIVEHKKD